MKIATLGPAGSNHDVNTRRYIEFHGIRNAEIVYLEDFFIGLDLMRQGEADLMVQVCAHHHVAEVIERHYKEIFLVDCFIGRTRPMGVISRIDVDVARTVGYIPPTAGYFNPSDWPEQVHTLSNSDTERRLLAGELDAGFTSLEIAQRYPERFRVTQEIGEVDVVWMVYGKTRVNTGAMIAWRDAPARRLIEAIEQEGRAA